MNIGQEFCEYVDNKFLLETLGYTYTGSENPIPKTATV